jgi:hypothetical protein
MQLHNRIDAAILSKNESVISKPYFSSAQNLMNWLIGKNLKQCKITIRDASFTKQSFSAFNWNVEQTSKTYMKVVHLDY